MSELNDWWQLWLEYPDGRRDFSVEPSEEGQSEEDVVAKYATLSVEVLKATLVRRATQGGQ